MPHDADDLRTRLQRLEESHAFAEHATEQLAEEVRALGRRVTELQAHIRRLELQVLRLNASPGPDPGAEPESPEPGLG